MFHLGSDVFPGFGARCLINIARGKARTGVSVGRNVFLLGL